MLLVNLPKVACMLWATKTYIPQMAMTFTIVIATSGACKAYNHVDACELCVMAAAVEQSLCSHLFLPACPRSMMFTNTSPVACLIRHFYRRALLQHRQHSRRRLAAKLAQQGALIELARPSRISSQNYRNLDICAWTT